MDKFNTIFPDNNRNAGGVQFYEYIHSHSHTLTKDKFMLYHTFYCAVSGSPIDPSRGTIYDYIKVNHIDGRSFIGKYYRCCRPCLCDVMKYVLVEHHTIDVLGESHEHMVLTINDPCMNEEDIPDEVTSSGMSSSFIQGSLIVNTICS